MRVLPALVAVAAALAVAIPSAAFAFTVHDTANTPDWSVNFCVESAPPSVGVTRARELLSEAIDEWHSAPGQNSDQALVLYQDDVLPCAEGAYRIRYVDWGGGPWAQTLHGDLLIEFYGTAWWDGNGTQGSDWSYLGVLTHEMGHAFGLHHAGNTFWTYDGNYLPTMAECPADGQGAAETVYLETIQQDDWGGATYLRGGARRYWNANPGFEQGLTHWGSSGASVGSAYAFTGSAGVRLAAQGNKVWITSVYDPWATEFSTSNPPEQQEMPGMDTSDPVFHVFGYYRHESEDSKKGVKVQYRTRYLQYDGTTCKRNGFEDHTTWSALTLLTPVCNQDPGLYWLSCDRTVVIDNSESNDATVLRAYLRSITPDGAVYVDKVGVFGGTDP